MPPAALSILGMRLLCFVFCSGLSSIKIREGSTVTQPITPNNTPFAITMPRSRPRVKDIKQRAMKPATVVKELPTTETRVS